MSGSDSIVHIEVHRDDAVPTCRVRGEIDASNVDSVFDRLLDCVDADEPGLVLDLEETTSLDSAGIRALFELSRQMRMRGQELRIAVPARLTPFARIGSETATIGVACANGVSRSRSAR